MINIDTKHLISNVSGLDELRFYKRIWIGYLHPPIVFIGLLSNLIVLIVLPKMKDSLSDKSRLQYSCLAGFNFMTLLTFHFLQVFLGDGLFFATNGEIHLYIEKMGRIACKLCWFSWFLCMALANYCYVEFCIERAISVSAPFKAIHILTPKVRFIMWFIIVIIPSFFIALFAAYVKELLPNARAHGGFTCGVPSSIGQLAIHYCIAACFIIYIGHVILMIICNLLILVKLHEAAAFRLKLLQNAAATKVGKNRGRQDTRTTMTLVLLSAIQVFLYLPAAFSCASFCFIYFQSEPIRIKYYKEFVELNNSLGLFNTMTCISHSMNFFVYYSRMAAFRKQVHLLLPFGFSFSSTQSGTPKVFSRSHTD